MRHHTYHTIIKFNVLKVGGQEQLEPLKKAEPLSESKLKKLVLLEYNVVPVNGIHEGPSARCTRQPEKPERQVLRLQYRPRP